VYEADVSSSEQVAAAAQHAVSTFGSIDTWVNNAGVWDLTTPCTQVTDALWDRVLAVNLTGVFYGTREALKIMTERGSGSIVNIASSAALGGARAGAAYTASKAGVVGLTKQVACEFARNGIRANVVVPGVIPSNLSSNAAGILGIPHTGITEEEVRAGQQAAVEALVPLGRMGTANEIGTIVSFLASSESSYMTGAVLEADGGWSAR
jgi:NAD(P)-dependent dehydrogenase (short-subunit alcohol dehydrogenase family)